MLKADSVIYSARLVHPYVLINTWVKQCTVFIALYPLCVWFRVSADDFVQRRFMFWNVSLRCFVPWINPYLSEDVSSVYVYILNLGLLI